MNTARFIKDTEVKEVVDELFSIDKTIVRQIQSTEDLNYLKNRWTELVKTNDMKICIVEDENKIPIAMYTSRLLPTVAGWWVGATKIKQPSTNFHTSAKIMVPALELLIHDMEQMGYYKFWMVAPEHHHNIRNSVMKKYSPSLNRYDWFDEIIIPKGGKCNVPLFEMHRIVVNWADTLVRMFVLKQEYRADLVKIQHKLGLNASKDPTPIRSNSTESLL